VLHLTVRLLLLADRQIEQILHALGEPGRVDGLGRGILALVLLLTSPDHELPPLTDDVVHELVVRFGRQRTLLLVVDVVVAREGHEGVGLEHVLDLAVRILDLTGPVVGPDERDVIVRQADVEIVHDERERERQGPALDAELQVEVHDDAILRDVLLRVDEAPSDLGGDAGVFGLEDGDHVSDVEKQKRKPD